MKELNKGKNGISLIVLVITIIVMIVLAAAIILSLQSSGIIGRANEAKSAADEANKKQVAQVALAEYELEKQLGGTTKTATEYVQDKLNSQNIDGNDVAVTEEGEILVGLKKSAISALEKGVKIGDYVDYSPNISENADYKVYDLTSEKETDIVFSTQIGENALKWRYMGIDDKGNAILLSEIPTTDGLLLSGAVGYTDGPNLLNELCNTLYSNEKLGESRSLNVDDVNGLLGASPVGKYYDSENISVDNPEKLTVGDLIKPPYNQPELEYTEVPEKGKNINDYISSWYNYLGTDYKEENSVEYKMIFPKILLEDGEEKNMNYWLATNCLRVYFRDRMVDFRLRRIYDGRVGSTHMFDSEGSEYRGAYSIRPVVLLNSTIEFKSNSDGVWSIG